MRNISEKSPHL